MPSPMTLLRRSAFAMRNCCVCAGMFSGLRVCAKTQQDQSNVEPVGQSLWSDKRAQLSGFYNVLGE